MGIALIGVGVFGVIGSVTGRLPSMLAALFDPSGLVSGGSGSGASANSPGNATIDGSVTAADGTGITSDIISSTSGIGSEVGNILSLGGLI